MRLSHLYDRNSYSWKEGLYFEMVPWYLHFDHTKLKTVPTKQDSPMSISIMNVCNYWFKILQGLFKMYVISIDED